MSATRHSAPTTSTTTNKNAKQSNANTSSSTAKVATGAMSGPRKLSARGQSKGLLSRKLSKAVEQPGRASEGCQAEQSDSKGKQREEENQVAQDVQEQPPKSLIRVKSIIPDPLAELPQWYSNDAHQWTVASAAQFRKKYRLHNPVGPRYYKNHHLAPSLDKRPPSVFSPSFPPMAASTDRLPDTAQVPSPTRSPSSSPLPTPTSSQVRIHDVRVRTRKTSQTAHDTVDMLDLTDPWGTNWHHQSPYDVGMNKDRSPDSPESPTAPTRPRRASMTSGPRHRAVVPSPLSQSTSAVHLASEPLTTHAPRRLSKRRKTFRGLFGSSDHESQPHMSRGGLATLGHAEGQALTRKLSHTGSSMQPSLASSANSIAPTDRSSKRQSVLGRLVKRFSVMRRSDASKSTKSSFHSIGQSSEHDYTQAGSDSPGPQRSESPEKAPHQAKTREATRRVPPPADGRVSPSHAPDESKHKDADEQSLVSVDQRYSMGKLTVANPDDPNSSSESPGLNDPSPVQPYQDVNFPLRASPEPIEYPPPHPPFHGHPVRAPLSVISEGETYMSSPRMQPSSIKESPVTPPTIPSVLSLPARSAALPVDRPIPPLSPPLPNLPNSPSLPEIPTAPSIVSVAAQPLPTQPEPSLPPTPVASRPQTPPKQEPQPQAVFDLAPEPKAIPKVEAVVEPEVELLPRAENSKTRSLTASNVSSTYQPIASYVDNSPLARASMIVNPPTPNTSSVAMPTLAPPPTISTSPPKNEPKATVTESPSSPKDGSRRMRSKHTETFKLVRTASGHVQTVDSSFVAEGEHWHVVESPKEERSRKSRRERSDEPEQPERRKSKRTEKEGASEEGDPQRVQTHARRASNDRGHGDTTEASQSQARSSRESSRRDSPHNRRSSAHERRRSSREAQADATRSTQTPVIYASRPHGPSTATSTASGARLEPRTSVSASTRPSSEFQSVHDMNALKAKDAWEIERLWKGRSMIYAPDGMTANGNLNRPHISSDSRPSTIMSHDLHRASTIPSIGGESANTVVSAYGSSHTLYTVHSPYQGPQHAATYPQFPVSPHSERSVNGAAPHPGATARYVQAVEIPALPPVGTSPPRANPLPEPPRLSSYKPPPLPPSLAGNGDGPSSPEYWNRYAGVTVTH